MRTFLFSTTLAIGAMMFVGVSAPRAEAAGFGLHLDGPGYHVDIGRPHHRRSWFRGGHHRGGHHRWHDTSHYHVVPGHHVWHGDHVDFVPPRVRLHRTGHVDHLHW